jgi:hypothetical protein
VLKPEQDPNLEAAARQGLRDNVSIDIAYIEEIHTFSGNERHTSG